MIDQKSLEKAKNVQAALQQFDTIHQPVKWDSDKWYCGTCESDFPCERMLLFMLVQGLAAMSAMLPTGNMSALMNRFMGGGNDK